MAYLTDNSAIQWALTEDETFERPENRYLTNNRINMIKFGITSVNGQ